MGFFINAIAGGIVGTLAGLMIFLSFLPFELVGSGPTYIQISPLGDVHMLAVFLIGMLGVLGSGFAAWLSA